MGDLNFQLDDPRDPDELRLAALWHGYAASTGACPVPSIGPTRRPPRATEPRATLDHACTPPYSAGGCAARLGWTNLSDHAIFTLHFTTGQQPNGRACTPAALRQLCPAAWADLRHRFRTLSLTYALPFDPIDIPTPPQHSPQQPRTEQLDPADPANLQDPPQANTPAGPPAPNPAGRIPLNPALMQHGRAFLHASLKAWWATWSRRRPPSTSLGDLLLTASRNSGPFRPPGPLAEWLGQYDWDQADLTPAQALQWATIWQREQQSRNHSRIHPLLRGPGVARPATAQYLRTGRQQYKARLQGAGVRDASGTLHTDGPGMDAILWADRGPLWTSAPPIPASSDALLTHYFAHRRADWPPLPAPNGSTLKALVLAQSGSAPGADGEPYELYHHGADFLVHLLAQGHYAANVSDTALEHVLGPGHDPLVWIPKLLGAEHPKH